jgi:hypothetical protein
VESVGEVLLRLGGWATAADLVAVTSRKVVAKAVDRGEVARLARGVYVLPGYSADVLTALGYDGVLSHLSAAAAWDLPLLTTPPKPHIMRPFPEGLAVADAALAAGSLGPEELLTTATKLRGRGGTERQEMSARHRLLRLLVRADADVRR